MKKLSDEQIRALIEAEDGNVNEGGAETFNELMKVMASKQDLKAFAFTSKAMLLHMERKVQSARKAGVSFLASSFTWFSQRTTLSLSEVGRRICSKCRGPILPTSS